MWTLEKIEQYISNGIEENINLDYKGSGALGKNNDKKKEISKDISAFANSAGGTVIYGVLEFKESEKRHLPEKIDAVSRIEFSKEWLEQIINSTIIPRIPGVLITPIQVGKKEENKVIYVVDIAQSKTVHQAIDKRYYRRYNFESIMMEDWEVKDIINRQNKSNIKVSFEPRLKKEMLEIFLAGDSIFDLELDIWAENKGNRATLYLNVFIKGGAETAKWFKTPRVDLHGFQTLFTNEKERKIKINDEEFVISADRTAILPNTSIPIGYIKLSSRFIKDNCKFTLQISTEDNSKDIIIKGREILE